MACCSDNNSEVTTKYRALYEGKTFEQARERSFLKLPLESYPSRMKMKDAGWFMHRNIGGEIMAACLYCKKAFTGWKSEYDPYKVHQTFSPKCPFISNARNTQTPSSPIIEVLSRHEEVPPSSHTMAELPKRIKSFEQWPHGSPCPSVDILAEAGLFYVGHTTRVKCFFCYGQMSITRIDDHLMSAHTNQCKYAKHLTGLSQRTPLNIQASNKIYELINISKDNVEFYFLQCVPALTPGILLSAFVSLPHEHELQTSDIVLKRLKPSDKLERKVNWSTSSDGPLVCILEDLARNLENLSTKSADIQHSIQKSSIPSIPAVYDPAFQCKTCLTHDASPHVVSIKCCHLGICQRECFSKWMTCTVCGYTLGRTICIRGV